MRNLWLDRYWYNPKNPLHNIFVVDEVGSCYTVPVTITDYGRTFTPNDYPHLHFNISSNDLFVYTTTLEDANQVIEQVFSNFAPKVFYSSRFSDMGFVITGFVL